MREPGQALLTLSILYIKSTEFQCRARLELDWSNAAESAEDETLYALNSSKKGWGESGLG